MNKFRLKYKEWHQGAFHKCASPIDAQKGFKGVADLDDAVVLLKEIILCWALPPQDTMVIEEEYPDGTIVPHTFKIMIDLTPVDKA